MYLLHHFLPWSPTEDSTQGHVANVFGQGAPITAHNVQAFLLRDLHSVCMCVYVCVCACVHVCVYVCMSVY
jgi:hypothetical protein